MKAPAAGGRPSSGLALLRKPEGITSFRALQPLKRALGDRKVGHAGTLDRFAKGLLVALAGSYSRLASYAAAGEKRYVGTIRFGAETDTLDPEGRIVAEAPAPGRSTLESALRQFRGAIRQRPPAYSAVHIAGKRAYARARAGEDPELPEREIEISELELLDFDGRDAVIAIRCSTGTYVRSLARDIALACASRAHLIALERTAIGPFLVEGAVDPDDFEPERDLILLTRAHAVALGMSAVNLREGFEERFGNGGKLDMAFFSAATVLNPADGAAIPMDDPSIPTDGRPCAVFPESGSAALGVVDFLGSELRYRVVIAGAES